MLQKLLHDNILVTGGAGFIGSHLVDKLIDKNHKVIVIDDLSSGYKRNVNRKARLIKCDLREYKCVDSIIRRTKPKIIFHLAENAAENKAQFSPIDITTRNYNSFLNVLVAGLKNSMKRIVITSSIAVYGSKQIPFSENDKPEPEDLYGLSKLEMEETLKILSKVHKFEYVITRPHNVYGPRQNMKDPYRNVVVLFMNAVLKGEPYYIYGNGGQRRCFSYISDVVEAIYKCGFLNVSGKIFNIGSDKSYNINELSKEIQRITNVKIKPKHLPLRPQEILLAISDHTLSKKYLKYKDQTSLSVGIKKTWEYAKKIGYQKPVFGGIELDSPLLPKNWKN